MVPNLLQSRKGQVASSERKRVQDWGLDDAISNAEVGYPYSPHRGDKHDIAYAEALWNTLRNANEHDIVVFGGGLHHLYHMNFNPQSIAKLLIKSMCQIGLVFHSDEEILLRGPNTIQQHLNN